MNSNENILIEKNRLLLRQLPLFLLGQILILAIVISSMWEGMNRTNLILWAGFVLSAIMFCYASYRKFRNIHKDPVSLKRWMLTSCLLMGLGWGALSFMHVHHSSSEHEVITILILSAISTLSIATLSSHRNITLSFLIPVLLSLILSQFFSHEDFYSISDLLLIFYSLLLLGLALKWHGSIKNMINTQLHNTTLLEKQSRDTDKLKINEERFRRASEFSNVGIWDMDIESSEVSCTECTWKLFGLDEPENNTIHLADFLESTHEDDFETVVDSIYQALLEGELYDIEYRCVWPDGSVHWIHAKCDVIRNEFGAPIRLLGAIRNITEKKESEISLFKEKEFLRAVLDNIEDGIVACDEKGELTLFNRSAKEIHGMTIEDISAVQCVSNYELYQEDGVTPMKKQQTPLQRALKGEKINKENMVVVPKHQSPHQLLCNGQEIIGLHGEKWGAVISLHDITEQKQYESALYKSRAEFEAIVNSISDAVVFVDINRKIIAVNPAITTMFGYSLSDLSGLTTEILYANPDDFKNQAKVRYGTNTNPSKTVYEMKYKHRNGTEFYGETLGTAVKNGTGNTIGFVGIIRDVTERKKIEESLSQFKTSLDLTVDCVFMFWPDTLKFFYANKGAIDQVGYTIDELMDMKVIDIKPDYDEKHLLKIITPLMESNHEHTSITFETIHQHKMGNIIPVEIFLQYISPVGEPARFVAIVRDISDRKQANKERDILQNQLQQAQKMQSIGQLTGGIAHDFNNMLASIVGYTDLALERFVTEEGKLSTYLHEVKYAGERGRDLIAQLLAFSRMSPSEPELMSISTSVNEALNMLRSIIPTNINVNLLCEDALPKIMMDHTHLNQIVMNLCINARDAITTDRVGQININITKQEYVKNKYKCHSCYEDVTGLFIEIAISDTGKGMSTEIMNKIFEPFYTTKDVDKGTGMGLSMVHGIIHEHGGHILVESTVNQGTTFRILLPVPENIAELEQTRIVDAAGKSEQNINSANILVVDDDKSVGLFIAELLEMKGYSITFESSSETALRMFSDFPEKFDALITDQTMPGMTGIQLTQKLLALRPELPVILCTGYSENIDEGIAIQQGVKVYLKKPIDTGLLLSSLHKLLA